MPTLFVNMAVMMAIKRDDVINFTSIVDWRTHISKLGDSTFMLLLEHRAIKCLDAVLTHCMDVDPNTGWTHGRFNEERSNTVGAVTQEGYIDYLKVYLKHAERRKINLATPVTSPVTFIPPIMLAANGGRGDVFKLFVDHRPMLDLNMTLHGGRIRGSTLLMVAVEMRSIAVLKLLLAAGDRVNVNAVDDNGDTALHWAAKSGKVEFVKPLLSVGNIDVSIKNNVGTVAEKFARREMKKLFKEFAIEKKRQKTEEQVNENNRMAALEKKIETRIAAPIDTELKKGTEKIVGETSRDTVPTVPASSVSDRPTRTSSCKMCSVTGANIVLQPCNHVALCVDCRDEARKNKQFKCPACKQRVFLYRQVLL